MFSIQTTLSLALSVWGIFPFPFFILAISNLDFVRETVFVGATSDFHSSISSSISKQIAGNSSVVSGPTFNSNIDSENREGRNILTRLVYSYDGSNNNFNHRLWGAKGEGRIRSFIPLNGYMDGIGIPIASPNLPSPSRVAMELFSRITPLNVINKRNRNRHNHGIPSQLLPYFGEFIGRDISVTQSNSSDPMKILCPNDEKTLAEGISLSFCPPGKASHPFNRSQYTGGHDAEHPRAPISTVSAFLDLSNIYGSDEETVRSLRALYGGEVALSENGLPLRDPETGIFVVADENTRAHPGLLSLAVTFLRHHNILAQHFADIHEDNADDEFLFQLARMHNIAIYQNIVEEKYLPMLLGDTLDPYEGHNSTVNPTIDVFFTTVAFRYGHSSVSSLLRLVDQNYQPIQQYDPLLLRDVFFKTEKWVDILSQGATNNDNGTVKNTNGLEPFIRGLSMEPEKDVDLSFVPDINIFITVSVFNIQRGRDHGIPPYNVVRKWLGLPPFQSFQELVTAFSGGEEGIDPQLVTVLSSLYNGDIGLMDAYVGALLETEFGDYGTNGIVGYTMASSIKDQFQRIRDGDFFWYKGRYSPERIRNFPSLSDLIKMVFPEGEMALFPTDSFAVYEDSSVSSRDGQVCPDTTTNPSLSLLSGSYTATWILDDNNKWIDLTLTVDEKIDGGFIGIGWGEHVMHGSIIWFCTDNADMINLDYPPPCDDESIIGVPDNSNNGSQKNLTLFTCCVAEGRNHIKPECLSEHDNKEHYRLDIIRECRSEEKTSVTIRAPTCGGGSDVNTTTTNAGTGNHGGDQFDVGNCFDNNGTIDFIVAYSSSSQTRPHGMGRRTFHTIDFTSTRSTSTGTVAAAAAASSYNGVYALHGVTMLTCWLILAPAAVFTVRYMKHKAWYLAVHITLMAICGSVTYPMMLSALVAVIEREGSTHRWAAVGMVAIFPFISGTGTLRRFSLEGTISLGSFDRYIWHFHRVAGWSLVVVAFWNCYLGLVYIGPQDSYIEFLSIDSTPIGLDLPVFGFIQRYLFWPYVVLLFVTLGCAELYRFHVFADVHQKKREDEGIWRKVNISALEPITHKEFNEATYHGKQLCIVDGCVIDISEYMSQHPGGKRLLRNVAGTDITLELLGKRGIDGMYHKHSVLAIGRLKTLLVARIEESKDVPRQTTPEVFALNLASSGAMPQASTKSSHLSSSKSHERCKAAFSERDLGSTPIFATAQITSFEKVTPLVSTMDKPVIQLFLLVPRISNTKDSNKNVSTLQTEVIGVALPGSVCVLRLHDSRGGIVERSQTPVRVKHLTNGDVIYEFFISMVPGGKMSTAMMKMKVDTTLLSRRPNVNPKLLGKINSREWPVILLLAAGTGISPILQVIDYFLTKCYRTRTQIFLVWVVKCSRHNFIDVCGIKEQVKRSKGTFKWIMIYSKSIIDGLHDDQSAAGNSVPASLRASERAPERNCVILPEKSERRRALKPLKSFGHKTSIGDACNNISEHDPRTVNSVGALKPILGTDSNWWKGGYLTGRLDGELLSDLVAKVFSHRGLYSVSFKENLVEDESSSENSNESKVSLELDIEKGEDGEKALESLSTDDARKYDDLLVAVSGRSKFEDECFDNLLLLGIKESQIIRFTD